MRPSLRWPALVCFSTVVLLAACDSADEGSSVTTRPGPSAAGRGSSSASAGAAGVGGANAGGSSAGNAGAGGEEPVPDGVGDDGVGEGGSTSEGGAGGEAGSGAGGDAGGVAAGGGAGTAGSTGGFGGSDGGAAGASGAIGAGGAGGTSATPECPCFLTAPTCGAEALAAATKKSCHLTIPAGGKDDVLHCPNGASGAVAVKSTCANGCKVAAGDAADTCELPACPCFASAGYCGAGVLAEATKRGCKATIPAGSSDDVLYCPNGQSGAFVVKQTCKAGCVSAPAGQVDTCKVETSAATYKLPVGCGTTATCTNANHTNTHTGKDEYAYDFGMPVGTSVRAIRAGTVLATRLVSPPGSACYNGGGTSCANYANTVEVKHSDGTVALYMHVSKILVKKGQTIKQGDEVAKSGQSGWVTGPHLHLQVQADCGIWWCQSKPFSFGEGTVATGTKRVSQNCP